MKKRVMLALIPITLLLGGWRPTIVRSATAEEDAQAKTFTPDPARALVYVYRNNALTGRSLDSQFVVDNAVAGTNKAGRFIVVSLTPGTHNVLSLSAKESSGAALLVHHVGKTPMTLTAEAGKIYFFQDVFKALGGFSLKAVPADDAKAAIAKEKLFARYEP